MIDSIKELRRYRQQMNLFFHAKASQHGVLINPSENEHDLDLCSRLYDESLAGRRILIDIDAISELPFDWYVKDLEGPNGTDALLSVFIAEPARLEALWEVYHGWMHKRMNAETCMQAFLRNT